MRKQGLWHYSRLLLLMAVIAVGGTGTAFAQSSSSSNYEVSETQFGAGSTLESCSDQYCAKASIGNMTSGNAAKSANSSAIFGPTTPDEPLLEVIVEPGESDLGILSTEKTSSKTTNIKIRSYMSDGYTLQIVGNAPRYNNHTLKTPSSPTASAPGTEQFGINLADNSTPNVGASPVQVPSSQMSFGVVEDDYKTPNLFKYKSGDVVARSLSESGQTDYTISMIINIANSTPAGHFTSDFTAVVMPVY